MNPQQEAVALWRAIEARGGTPNVRQIGNVLRSCFKLRFRQADLARWLQPFQSRDVSGNGRVTLNEHAGNAREQSGNDYAREKEVSLVSNYSSGTTYPHPEAPKLFSIPDPPAKKRAPRLDLTREQVEGFEIARAVIKAIGPEIELVVKPHGTTMVMWAKKNRPVLVDMARSGMTADQIIDSWRRLCSELGYVVYSMHNFQKRLLATGLRPVEDELDVIGNDCDPPSLAELRKARRS